MSIPHKIKIFVWRFCRNSVPVRSRLSAKGIHLPITCHMCNADVEHLLHIFFDCTFAKQCWHYMGFDLDMNSVEYTPDWLLDKLFNASGEELNKICVTLWGIWIWRNKRVWENQSGSAALAIDSSLNVVLEWRKARNRNQETSQHTSYQQLGRVAK